MYYLCYHPGGIFTKQLRQREEELNKYNTERITIVEKGGQNLESLLARKDPFEKEKCKEKLCPLCTSDSKEKNSKVLTSLIYIHLV